MKSFAFWLCLWVAVAACVAAPGSCDEPANDPTAKKVEKARSTFKADADKLKSSVSAALEKRVDAARKAGDKDQLDALVQEIEQFESGGPIPGFLPEAYHKKQVVMLQKLESSLEGIIKEYTKDGKDSEAEALSSDLKAVRKVLKLIEVRKVLVGTWTMKFKDESYTADLIFRADGSGYQTTSKEKCRWELDVDAGQVTVTYQGGTKDTVKLPIDPRETKMVNRFGNDFSIVKKK